MIGSAFGGNIVTTAVLRLVLSPLVIAACSSAAFAETGVALDFDIGVRVQGDSNPDLTAGGSDSSITGGVDLSFGLTNETALSRLSLQGSTGLLSADGDGTTTLSDTVLGLSYVRTTANAALTLDASLRDVALEDGSVIDFGSGTGRKRTATLSTGAEFGIAGPLGFGVNAAVTDLRYRDTSDPTLIDSTTVTLGGHIRTDLSQVLHLNLGLANRQFDQDGTDTRDTQSVDLGLTLDRPTGTLALMVTADNTPDGQRLAANFERRMDLPSGSVTYSLGATRGVSDQTYATGALSYIQDLSNGRLGIDLARTVQPGADTDTETLLSIASLGYSQPVTPTANLALSLNWAEQRDTVSDQSTANTNLSATWTQMLTPDWALDLGYTHLLREDDLTGRAQSDQLSLRLHRAFSLRF